MDVQFLAKTYCCCCLNDIDEMLHVQESLNETFKISEAIFICIGIQYDDKTNEETIDISKYICTICLNDLRQSLNFRLKCESSYQIMKQQIDIQSLGSSITEIEELTETNNYLCDNYNAKCLIGNEEKWEKCTKTFPSKNELKKRMKKTSSKVYSCNNCNKEFKSKQRLELHTYSHTDRKDFQCDSCDKSFATHFRLRSHKRAHTGERPYQCSECKVSFAQSNALKCHQRIHTGEKPFVCEYCNKSFTQKTILKTHMTLHIGKTVECSDCDKKFSRPSFLILHMREHSGEKPYACDKCPNRYNQKSHLDRHLDTHLGIKYSCKLCEKQYTKNWSLKMHMYTHSKTKPFNCDTCSKSFIRRDKYTKHIELCHPSD